ncbi:gli-kruppel family member gli2b [Moniliophthora roreri MCA 2997]|uniref:Gli-kruppel family member gli2b n=1 Tax=Moniliophthora roreri (strain MCA 2997) TaxID=1381753 RepID=V2XQG3_MONRO|nr:gli-kruppel family member gli2b [Moniliophthora roreri MCA 2997]
MYQPRPSSSSSSNSEGRLLRGMANVAVTRTSELSSRTNTPRPLSGVTLGVFNGDTARYSWAPLGQSVESRGSNSAPSSNVVYFVNGPLDGRSSTATSIPPKMLPKRYTRPSPEPLKADVRRAYDILSLEESFLSTPSKSSARSSSSDYSDGKSDWSTYAEQLKQPGEWRCGWKEPFLGGELKRCHYSGKKQLVKRHIENVHLKIKPFTCPHCNQTFSQKTSLNVHISAKHTKEEPHVCSYPGCEERYNDPARLHRHKVDTHGYVPKAISRKNAERQAEFLGRSATASYIPYAQS